MATLKTIGENALIERLTRGLASARDVVVGPGDDCAVVRDGNVDWLLTSDPVIEGVHFKAQTPPAQIGRKAVARSLSDIAAMGGNPRWCLINLVAPAQTEITRLDAIYKGVAETAASYDLTIVGGDVAQGPVLELHIFVAGNVATDQAVLRSGANPGDVIFVTGALGGSQMDGRHLTFTPRLREGAWLASQHWVTAMCDISDGLSTDLCHIARASGVGAALNLDAIPCSEAARSDAAPLTRALSDGEDFELLFTIPADKLARFPDAWRSTFDLPCTRIGTITEPPEIIGMDAHGERHPLTPQGFDHFAGGEPA